MIWHRFVVKAFIPNPVKVKDLAPLNVGYLEIMAIPADVAGGNSAVTSDMLVAELIEYLQMALKMNAPVTLSSKFWTIEKVEA